MWPFDAYNRLVFLRDLTSPEDCTGRGLLVIVAAVTSLSRLWNLDEAQPVAGATT
jgi:hypothetical protein